MSKSHCQLASFIVRQFSFFDKNCKYILHLKLLPYYGSRGNVSYLYHRYLNLQLSFKFNLTRKIIFYLFLCNDRWIEPRHACTYWFITVISYILSVFSLTVLSSCCSFYNFKSFVVTFTCSNLLLSITQVLLKQENF